MQRCWIKSIRSKDAFISTVITDCEQKNISSIISTSREKHNSFLSNILNPDSTDDAAGVTPTEKMNHKLKSEKEKEKSDRLLGRDYSFN